MGQINLFNHKNKEELEATIKEQAQKYYTSGDADLSDEEFDRLVDELREIDPDSDVLNATGWGYSVDEDTTVGERVPHKYGEVKGLAKFYNWDECSKSLKGVLVQTSLKLDGLSIVLYYTEGVLTRALTRGDGPTGIDVTNKVIRILGTNKIKDKFTGSIRGEIMMSHEDFKIFKQRHEKAKNARNSAAGLMNGDEITEDFDLLRIIVYRVRASETHKFYHIKDVEMFLIYNFGKQNVVTTEYVQFSNSSAMINFMHNIRDHWDKLGLPSDGVVTTNVNLNHNSITHCVEYDSMAFKFESEQKEVTVVDVEWRMTKNRLCVPRVRITPVELAGTTVTYATGFHAKFIKDSSIGVGSKVVVEKRGEIIPNIVKVISQGECTLPDRCSSCDDPLIMDGVHLVCKNSHCGNATKQDLLMWLKYLAPIDGFGTILQMKFLNKYYGQDPSIENIMDGSLVRLSTVKSDSAHFNLFLNMIDKLYNAKIILADAICALNIPRFGEITARKLADYPELIIDIIEEYTSDSTDHSELFNKLSNAIGVANTNSAIKHMWKFERLQLISDRIIWETSTPERDTNVKVAITGKLSVKRSDFEKELRSAGFTVGDISKDTNFLITDDPNSSSSKNKKADEWGITKLTEAAFREMFAL